MNMRKIAYFIMTFSFILIVSGSVSTFVINLRDDQNATRQRMVVVGDKFEDFSANTSVFESFREDLYGGIFDNVYFDTLYSNDINIKNKLSNYENLVDELKKNTNSLDELCNDMYYPDGTINSKCNNYKSIYEQVVNYFVTDINNYNNNVKKYNEYQKSINSDKTLALYKTDKDYIDYNEDKIFDGKEV